MKNIIIQGKNFSNLKEEIKEHIASQLPSKEIIITEIGRRISKKYLDKDGVIKKESREDIQYEDQPLRKNNIILRKPEIKYRREDVEETPEIIHRSIMEDNYPED